MITVDGVNRMVKVVNGSVPGPPLVVYEGQMVTVHISNMMLSDSTTIHFHGLHQKATPYFDGMPYITQCPVAAGQSFTHEFKVCLLYTSPSPRDKRQSRMPSSA